MGLGHILGQLRFCEAENDDSVVLPASKSTEGVFLGSYSSWDRFLFRGTSLRESGEIVEGLWIGFEEGDITVIDGVESAVERSGYVVLRTLSQNRIHFAGFLADLIPRLGEMSFEEALEATLEEWRRRWSERAERVSFIERVGLFGELVVLRDLLISGNITDARPWVARDHGLGLHDFRLGDLRLEVKTSTIPVAEIHVFDEDQMHHRDGLHLLLVKIEASGQGESIIDLANEIIENIESDDQRAEFTRKLESTGCNEERFQEERFTVTSRHYWESCEDSPFLQEGDIDIELRAARNISYQVSEEDVPFSEVEDFGSLFP